MKIWSFVIILLISMVSFAETITLSSIDTYTIDNQSNQLNDFFIGDKNVVNVVKNDKGNYEVSAVALYGKTYVVFFKSDGSNVSYFFEVVSSRGIGKEKKETLLSGTLTGRTSFDKNNNQNPYSASLKMKARLSKNTSFGFSSETVQKKGSSQIGYEISSWQYDFFNNYLNWQVFTEPTASVPYYASTRFRGYNLGQKDKNYEFFVWKANQYLNEEENTSFKAQGFSVKQNFKYFDYSFDLNNKDNRYVPLASLSFEAFKLYNGFNYSQLGEKRLFQYTGYRNFNENVDTFTLKNIYMTYSVAPKGTYSLDSDSESFNQKFALGTTFANEDSFSKQDESKIDTIPGIVSASISYDSDNVNTFFLNKTRFFAAYGKSDYLTFSGLTEYGVTVLDYAKSETFMYSPRLSFYFLGNKVDGGYYLRNEYITNINKNYFLNLTEDYRNTLGVFRSSKRFNYGLYLGNSRFFNGDNDNYSKIYGASLQYYIKDNVSSEITFEKSTTEAGSYGENSSAQLRYFSGKNFELRSKVDYSENFDNIKSIKRNNIKGSLGFVWNFDYGVGNIYDNTTSKYKKLSGEVFEDLNFNGIRDPGEPLIEGVEVSVLKVGENDKKTDSNGFFSFQGFDKDESVTINLNSDKYSSGEVYRFNMSESHFVQIPMYRHIEKKVYFKDSITNNLDLNAQFNFSCEKKSKLKREMFSEYVKVFFPSNQICEPEISENSSNLMLVDFTDSSDKMIVLYRQIPKLITFVFDQKIKSLKVNGKKIEDKNKEIVKEIDEYQGFLDIQVEKNCQITPNLTAIPYISLKNQNFFKITCF